MKKLLFILSLNFLVLSFEFCNADWQQTNGPFGGKINCLATSGTNVFAGTYGGVFLSTNNGGSWNAVNNGLTYSDIRSLAISGTNIFAGGAGVFLSTNNGGSWNSIGLTSSSINSLAISGSNIFAGTSSDGVFLSTNNGVSWTAVNNGLTNKTISSLIIIGGNIFAGTRGGGVFLSTNNGASWTAVNNGLTTADVMSLAKSGTNIFAGTFEGGVFLSTNNGANWKTVNNGLPGNSIIYSLGISGTNLFAGTTQYDGIFLSTNNGTSWTNVNNGMPKLYAWSFAFSGTNIFAGTDGGVFLSSNNGGSWTTVNNGLIATNPTSFALSGANIFAGTYGGGVFFSNNNGINWTEVNNGLTNHIIDVITISGGNIFAGTFGGGLFLSTNNGGSWSSVSNGISNYVTELAINGGNIYAGSFGNGIFLSTNNGASWTAMNNGLTTSDSKFISALVINGINIFAGTQGAGVFLSTNNGASWTAMNNGLLNNEVYSLAISGGNIFAGTNGAGIFLSTNNGASWTAVNNGLYYPYIYSLIANGGNIFAGTYAGVFLSTNNGANWIEVNSGLPYSNLLGKYNSVGPLAIIGTNIFTGTGGDGVWKRALEDMAPPQINVQPQGGIKCEGQNMTFSFTAKGGLPMSYQWYKNDGIIALATDSIYSITNLKTTDGGQYKCVLGNTYGSATSTTCTLTVNPLPSANTGTTKSICTGTATQIGATAISGNTYFWTSSPAGFTSAISNPIVSPTVTTTYTLTETITATGCNKTNSVLITVNPLPATNAGSANSICIGTSTQIGDTAISGNTYSWSSSPIGFTSAISNPTVSPTVTTTYTLTETITATGCNKTNSVIITVNAIPSAPTVTSSVTYCQNETASLLTATGSNLLWYTTATGGTGNSNAPLPLTTNAGTTNYYVSQTANTCESTRAMITVTVIASPSAPNITSPVNYCQNATASALTATGSNLLWYTSVIGGIGSSNVPIPSTINLGTTNYYVSQTVNSCESSRASITVNVYAIPSEPTVTPSVTYCQDAVAVALTAAGSNLLWYTYETGGTGNSIAPIPSTANVVYTSYYVSQTVNTCESPRAMITVIIKATPLTPNVTSLITYCQNDTALQLTATGTNLLWYTKTTGGIGSVTAPIPSTVSAGTTSYFVTQTVNGCESIRAQIDVTINATPLPTVTTPVNYCQNATASILTETGSNLLWYTAATGSSGSSSAPTPLTTNLGTTNFYVSQTINSCESPRAMITVNVYAIPLIPTATSPIIYCQYISASPLTATGSNLLWYTEATGGTGNNTLTPSTLLADTTSYYVSQSPEGCESSRAQIDVIVKPSPSTPTVISYVTYCQNVTAFQLTATGSALLWYTKATGGFGSSNAPTPSTAIADTTIYYVSQTENGCESQRANITVIVNPIPSAPSVTDSVNYCQNETAIPLSAKGSNLLWYLTATGGTGSAIAPTPLTTNAGTLNYYVSQTLNSCESQRALIAVTVKVLPSSPNVTNQVAYCQNSTASPLTATGSNLLWYITATGGTGSAIAPTPLTSSVGKTTYFVSQTDKGCESNRAQIDVIVNPKPPTPTITYISHPPHVDLIANPQTTDYSYQWFTNLTYQIPGATKAILLNADSCIYYTVQISNSYGCKATSSYIYCPMGIDEINSINSYSLYPNPSNDKITIENNSINKIKDLIISIYNIQGQLIFQKPMQQKKIDINISDFAKGVYIVKLSNSENVIVKRVVKD